ncbi:MAG: type II toxin-antitoxin system prevent-host-death family antitoxin [Candidatus Rokubacteria bacterium]|nr:type II toxin-antitoxin system prevent-host-death family antitoxin [Candidatus Rokubacteria bacterium]
MKEASVGVRELKARLSEHLREVKAGRTIAITERGRTVGRIVPVGQPIRERLEAMRRAGLLAWSGRKLPPARPAARARGPGTVADLLVEDRERE